MNIFLFILSILPAVLSGEFNPQTLSVAEQDSILASQTKSHSDAEVARYSLQYENEDQLFRRSKVAEWYIYDSHKKTRKPLGGGMNLGKVRDAVLSPNGRYVAFAKDNNLYIHKLDFGTEVAVTKDANPDIINGVADWLYEEEFGTTALFAWSPDSKQLAFVRLNESDVPSFAWQTYLEGAYPHADTLRYPKAGCANASASVCVYDVATKAIQTMQLPSGSDDVYIPRLRWMEKAPEKKDQPAQLALLVLRLNRDQNKMEIFSCNPRSTVAQLLYKEESKRFFIDYSLFDEWKWLSTGSFVLLSEKEGWRRAYLYSEQGFQQKILTPAGMDVTAVYGVDEATQTLYYQAAPTPATRQVYAVSIKSATSSASATPVLLTSEEGIHSARFAADYRHMIDCYQSFYTPNRYSLMAIKGTKASGEETILDNASLKAEWSEAGLPEPQLMTIPNANGQPLEAMLLLPNAPMPNGQYPLVLMHYSGPQSQRVLNRWRKRFEYALVEAGYAVLIVDARGSDCRGREWRNETYMNLGIKEAEDLIAAANYIGQRPDIDASRMAIMGWSYGGYQSLMTMSTKGHPFKAGVAIAPVTDWRLYDSAYTERYMRRPQVNEAGYNNASLMNHAADLSGNVLIVHGMADDNVHAQHTMKYIEALVQADKQFEMQIYPDDNHFLKRGKNYTHLHNRIMDFLNKNLY